MKKVLRPSNGHILDIDSLEIADQFLSYANNVNTRKGFPSRVGGRRACYGVAAIDPYHLLSLHLNSFDWWMLFGTNTVYGLETVNSFNITTPGWFTAVANPREWVSTLLNGIPVFANGKDPLNTWDGNGAHKIVNVPAWPAGYVCKAVVAFRFHLFAMNINQGGPIFDNLIIWSDAAAPGSLPASWTPAATNEAGSAVLADTPGPCIMGLPLGQQLLIYKPTSVYVVEYAGNPPASIFTVRCAMRSVGALGPHTVIEMGEKHLVVGNDDIVLTDGVNSQSIANDRIKTYLANSIDDTNSQNAFVIRDLSKQEVWVCVPEGGNQFCTIAHVWDVRRNTWVTRSLTQVRHGTTGLVTDTAAPSTWDADAGTWDSDSSLWDETTNATKQRLVLAQASQLYVEDTTDIISVTSLLRRTDLTFDDDSQRKLTSRVWVEGSGDGLADAQFRLGSRENTQDSIAWGAFAARTAEGTPYEIEGRYISIEVQTTSLNPWTISRLSIEANYCGAY